MKIEQIDALLRESLPPKRYEHSVNVMYEAVVLADYYQVDEKKTRIAALLHDCGREIPLEAAVLEAKKLGLNVSQLEEEQPILLHAALGRAIAANKYEVKDDEVLTAIEQHTTGDKDMSKLSMIVFLADLIEPARKQKNVEKLRRLVRKGLEPAMLAALSSNISYLMQNGRLVHPNCLECWNGLLLGSDKGND